MADDKVYWYGVWNDPVQREAFIMKRREGVVEGNHFKDWDLRPSRGLAHRVLALRLQEEGDEADAALPSVSY